MGFNSGFKGLKTLSPSRDNSPHELPVVAVPMWYGTPTVNVFTAKSNKHIAKCVKAVQQCNIPEDSNPCVKK